jgi:hypothetical protein
MAQRGDESTQRELATFDDYLDWSHLRIPREFDINRETVGKYTRLADSKPAVLTFGSNAGRQSLYLSWEHKI